MGIVGFWVEGRSGFLREGKGGIEENKGWKVIWGSFWMLIKELFIMCLNFLKGIDIVMIGLF